MTELDVVMGLAQKGDIEAAEARFADAMRRKGLSGHDQQTAGRVIAGAKVAASAQQAEKRRATRRKATKPKVRRKTKAYQLDPYSQSSPAGGYGKGK